MQTEIKMFAPLIAVCFFLGCAYGSPSANQYMDSVINTTLRNEISTLGLDPTSLENFITQYEDKMAVIGTVKGKAEYNDGSLIGMSQVRRHSDCQGPYQSFGARNINCTLAFEKLKVKYDGKVKYGKMPSVDIKGKSKMENSLVFVEISQAPAMQPVVKNFLYQQAPEMEVKHTGLGPLNRFTGVLDDGFKRHVQTNVSNSIAQRFQNALNRAVATMPLPN